MSPRSAETSLPTPFGPYRVVRPLGRGGMGAVYLAEDSRLERKVALKVPHFRAEDGPAVRERFLREARAAAALQHPNVCPIYDIGEIDGTLYLTMAFIDGRPLSDFVRPDKPLTSRTAATLVFKIAQALQEAHALGIIHRDLKPSNVMIDRRKEPIVMDFGLARRLDTGSARLTSQGAIIGTPSYMSPEQVEGPDVGPPSDIYSLGVILYELLTGRVPFEGPPMSVLAQLMRDTPRPPREHRGDLDADLDRICLKAMARRPEDRFASMAQFAVELQKWLRLHGGNAQLPQPLPLPAPAAAATPSPSQTVPGERSVVALAATQPDNLLSAPHNKRSSPLSLLLGGATAAAIVVAVVLFVQNNQNDGDGTRNTDKDPPDDKSIAGKDERKPEPPPPPPMAGAPGGVWRPLFNGKELSSWVPMITVNKDTTRQPPGDGGWDVVDGEIVCKGRRAGWLRSDREYSDFVLTLEFQLPMPSGNSGIHVWTPERGNPWQTGTEIQLLASDAATETSKRSGAIHGVIGPAQSALKPSGSWNHLLIRCERDEIEVTLNGTTTAKTRVSDHAELHGRPRSGFIGLSNWNNEAKGGRFRRIFLCDLKDVSSPPPLPASIMDGAERAEIATWTFNGPARRCMDFSPDGHQVLVGNGDGSLTLWDVATGQPMYEWAGLGGAVIAVSFGPDGKALSIASKGPPVVWDLRRLRQFKNYDAVIGDIHTGAIAPDGRHVLVGGTGIQQQITLLWWDTIAGKVTAWPGHTAIVTAVGFSADGKRAISGDSDGKVLLWDIATAKASEEFECLPGPVTRVGLSRDASVAFTAGYTAGRTQPDLVRAWTLRGGKPREIHKLPGTWFDVSEDGKRLLSNGEGNAPHSPTMMLDMRARAQNQYPAEKIGFTPRSRTMSPDGRLLLLGGGKGQLMLWRLPKR